MADFNKLLCVLVLLAACGDDDTDSSATPDASPPRPGDSGAGNDDWTIGPVSDTEAGQGISMVVTSSGPVVAYLATSGIDSGPCEEVRIGDEVPPPKTLFNVYIARRSGASWSEEMATQILSATNPQGLDLAADGSDLLLAALAGEPYSNPPLNAYCGANDLGLYDGSADWSPMSLVVTSGEAPGPPGSDSGFAVGFWPAIAMRDGKGVIAYRDVHFGGLQSDDERRADLEAVVNTGGGWQPVPVDMGRGAGEFSDAAIDADGNLYIAYANTFAFDGTSRGTHVAKSMDNGATWETVRVGESAERGPSLWFDAEGTLRVAFYDDSRGQMVLATNTDDTMFASMSGGWETEFVGDPRFDEGRDPSGVSGPGGLVALAYYRCARTGASGCESDDDALVLAWKNDESSEWTYETVDEGSSGGICGNWAVIGIDGFDALWVAYLCQEVDGASVEDRVRVAERDPL